MSIESSTSLRYFWDAHAEWSEHVIGPSSRRGPLGPLRHLAKEVEEAIDTPDDIMEFADLILLSFDATRRAGFTYDDLEEAVWRKLEIVKGRKWVPAGDDEAMEHVRDTEPPSTS